MTITDEHQQHGELWRKKSPSLVNTNQMSLTKSTKNVVCEQPISDASKGSREPFPKE